MKPAPFAYRRPGTLAEAVAALAGEPNAKVLAGGQSLVPLLSMRLAAPAMLVDINGLPGPGHDRRRRRRRADRCAGPARRRPRRRPTYAASQPLVPLALANVAHATIRNRGTTVGSLVHADAAAEMPVVLSLLGGSLEVEGPGGRRTIPAAELYVGPLESSVGHDEIAVSAYFPALAPGAGVAFEEIARRHGDYALVGAAALVDGDSVKVGYLSVSDVPTVVDLTGVADDDLGEAALAQLEPADDIHASAAYRAQLVRVLTERVVRSAECSQEGGRAMSEELHDVRLTVNGTHPRDPGARAAAALRRAAPRPRAHRHPRRLRARRLRRLHDPGRRRARCASCLMFAVSADGSEITTVEGLTNADGSLSHVQQAFVGVPRAAVRLLHARASSPRSPPGCATTRRPRTRRPAT